MDRYIVQAIREAYRSNQKKHRHGCLIINNDTGKVLCSGFNHVTNHPLHDTYSVHAEMHALAKFNQFMQRKYRNCSMIVVRIGKQEPKNSHPCSSCTRSILKRPEIRRVYYT